MAERKNEEGGAEKVEGADDAGRARQKYPHDRLIAESELLVGHPPHVMVGALCDEERDELTVNQAKDRVQRWLSA